MLLKLVGQSELSGSFHEHSDEELFALNRNYNSTNSEKKRQHLL